MGEDPGALRREVEEARAQLGETVDALAHKVSAPRRLVDRAAAALRSRARPETMVVAGACVVVVLAMEAFSRRRRSR